MTHFDQWGLFRWLDGDEGNNQLFLAEYLVAGGQVDWTRMWEGMNAGRITRGLYRRHPVHFAQDAQSPDNLIGLGVISWRDWPRDGYVASDILDYLKAHRGMYRIEPSCPWYREWMYRFPSVICHLNWCAGRKPPMWQRLCWALTIAFKIDNTKHDAWILGWLCIEVAGDKGWLERWATRRFWKRFPWRSCADLLAEYFGGDQSHPIVLELRKNT